MTACCLKCLELNLVTNFDRHFYSYFQCVQQLCSETISEFLFAMCILPFVGSGGKRGCEGGCLPFTYFYFFFSSSTLVCLSRCSYLLFYLSLLCCVVLYKWLEADLHGKSSDTANKASGKQGLRTKQSTGPLCLFTFRLPATFESN